MEKEKWTTAGENNEMWNGEGSVQGIYVSKKEDVGQNKSNIYNIRKADKALVGIWGSTVLDGRFSEIEIGSEVKVTALGEKESKTGKTYKDYTVEYREVEKSEEDKIDIKDIKF